MRYDFIEGNCIIVSKHFKLVKTVNVIIQTLKRICLLFNISIDANSMNPDHFVPIEAV